MCGWSNSSIGESLFALGVEFNCRHALSSNSWSVLNDLSMNSVCSLCLRRPLCLSVCSAACGL